MDLPPGKPRAALVGYGYWGPNLLRNLFAHGGFQVVGVVEPRPEARLRCQSLYPHVPLFADLDELFDRGKPEAVLIATPPPTHADLAVRCLEQGADVLIEKPMAVSVAECDRILDAAERRGRKVMVDHTYVYNPAIRYISDQIRSGSLGRLLYYDSVRVNLGGFQNGTNVLWDLAPHDLSILDLFLEGKMPKSVTTMATNHFDSPNANLCYCHFAYEDNFVAHLHLNWIAPLKVRTLMVTGMDKMCLFDENQPAERVKIFDKGMTLKRGHSPLDPRVEYRIGDVLSPSISHQEALSGMMDAFHRYLTKHEVPVSDGRFGRRIVTLLERASASLSQMGQPVTIDGPTGMRVPGIRKVA